MNVPLRAIAVGLLMCGLIASCGGGGGPSADGGIGGTGISSGKITGFGSVFVNGVEFDTTGAAVFVDGQEASEDDLGIGMIVTIEGTFDGNGRTGTAARINYSAAVRGPIDTVGPGGDSITVLGKTVFLENDTVFEGVTPATLAQGHLLEVSGYGTADGSVRATRIGFVSTEFVPGLDELEITGPVENLDAAAGTFSIDGLVIDYSEAGPLDVPGGKLSEGLAVRVVSTQDLEAGVLIAEGIEWLESPFEGADGLSVDIEGIVTQFSSPAAFEMNGIPVETDSATRYELGEAGDIGLDAQLAIEGVIDSDGVLHADRIEFRGEGEIEIEAPVQSVNVAKGTVVLMGVTVETTSATILSDHSDAAERPFGLADLREGDWVVAVGDDDDGVLSAVRIERRNPELQVGIDGPVTAASDPVLEVFGISVVTTESTQFQDSNDLPITAEEFFAKAVVDSIVGVDGTLTGSTIVADEVQLGE